MVYKTGVRGWQYGIGDMNINANRGYNYRRGDVGRP